MESFAAINFLRILTATNYNVDSATWAGTS